MKERNFINQNKDKWKELEDLLKDDRKDADRLSRLFIEVSDDLSYARTFYPNRFVKVYLNSITQKLFYSIYKNKSVTRSRFMYFWKEELPRLIYSARKELLFSFLLFVAAFAIGVLSSMYNNEFPSVILGKHYVEMTLDNIKKGDPMAVYKQSHQVDMFLGITINNLYVSFLTFITGLFFCIGSFGVLLYNGIMLGVFQYFFYKHGLLFTSTVTVWLHGTLEISSIIIASTAGITMGKGMLFPGTYTRPQAFFISARRGIKILLSILPLIVIAGIIESFLTRYTETPVAVKVTLILASAAFIIFYFIIYPYQKNKQQLPVNFDDAVIQESPEQNYDISQAYSNGMIYSHMFRIYQKHFGALIKNAFLYGLLGTIIFYFYKFRALPTYWGSQSYLNAMFNYNNALNDNINYIITTFVFSLGIYGILRITKKSNQEVSKFKFKDLLKVIFIVGIINLGFLPEYGFTIVIFLISLPFMLQWLVSAQMRSQDLISGITKTFSILDNSLFKAFGFFIITTLTALMFFFLIDSPAIALCGEILQWNLSLNAETTQIFHKILRIFIPLFTIFLILPLFVMGSYYLYFSMIEIRYAQGLSRRVEKLRGKS